MPSSELFALGCAIASGVLGGVKAFQTKGHEILAWAAILIAFAVVVLVAD